MSNFFVRRSVFLQAVFFYLITLKLYHMKKDRFKNNVFCCSVQNNKGEIINFYQTAKNRFDAYEEICKLYPVKAGYCRRLVSEQV